MKNENIKRIGILMDRDDWEVFKKICKAKESDASKELRKFIKEYIQENKEILNKLF